MADPRQDVARRDRVARPSPGLADLADLVGGESDRSRRFLGGLAAGALVGAAIVGAVGAALVRRRDGGVR